jgi:hypothetical protein
MFKFNSLVFDRSRDEWQTVIALQETE